jgi:hypothetical protein
MRLTLVNSEAEQPKRWFIPHDKEGMMMFVRRKRESGWDVADESEKRCRLGCAIAIGLCAAIVVAVAQGADAQVATAVQSGPATAVPVAPGGLPTNLPGVVTFPAPPADLDVLSAPDALLARYGIPPRPKAPEALAAWQRAMATPHKRIMPVLEQTNIFHGPARLVPGRPAVQVTNPGAPTAGPFFQQTYNWSGWAIYDPNLPWRPNGNNTTAVNLAEYSVPVGRVAFGTCPTTERYSAQWVGIDGFVSQDTLQSGTEVDAYNDCAGSFAYYTAWFEWYPNPEIRITNFPIAPGDYILVEVFNTAPSTGCSFILDFSRNASVTVCFSAPPNTSLVGDTVEWIVERPVVNGVLSSLTNYIDVIWPIALAESTSNVYFPGSTPTGSNFQLEMLDNSNNDISDCSLINFFAVECFNTGSSL